MAQHETIDESSNEKSPHLEAIEEFYRALAKDGIEISLQEFRRKVFHNYFLHLGRPSR
jgi:hypothetical protein